MDSDGNGKVDRVYAGDLQGNLWVFNLKDNTSRLLFTAKDSSGKPQPITSKPTVIRHPSETTKVGNQPNMLVLFGTGSYLKQSDLANSDDQSFYAVWDDDDDNGAPNLILARSNLVNQALTTGTDSTLSIAARTTSSASVDYNLKHGWYIDLDSKGTEPSERVVTSANVYQGIVFFTTYAPSNNPCDAGGESWFMTMKASNGAPPDRPIISINSNRTIEDADVVTIANVTQAPSGLKLEGGAFGVRLTKDSFIIATPNSRQNLFHNLGTLIEPAGRISWRELRRE